MRRIASIFPLLLLSPLAWSEDPPADEPADLAESLYDRATQSERAYKNLEHLADHIGHRLSGSESLAQAVEWAAASMREGGLQVRLQPVQVPHWERGQESAQLLSPVPRDLEILGLGMTVGGEVEAEVAVLSSFEELENSDVSGKIVLFDVPFTTYSETVAYRTQGPSRAAAKGAVAMLVRSVSPESLYTPHTGTLRYSEDAPQIPAAAVTLEDAAWLHRMADDGETIRLRLSLGAQHHGMVESHNVIADLPGRELQEEAVLVACHLDSWDVGQGAQDDGAGCMIAWESAQLLLDLGLTPRRTVRVVMYTAEENGIWGGKAYAEEEFDALRLVAALESDSGNGVATSLRLDLSGFEEDLHADIGERVAEFAELMKAVGLESIQPGYSGADILPSVKKGVIGFGLGHDTSDYWPIHHTHADTFDKIIPEDLAHNVGIMAAAVFLLAEAETPLAPTPKKKRRWRR